MPQALKSANDFGNIRQALLSYFPLSERELGFQLLRVLAKLN
ncbi:MAG: hypothetical protein ABSB33_05770 [Tepidisphaeraceae bacterium]